MAFYDQPAELADGFKYYIDFFSIPTGESVQFKAFLTDFTDSFESEWSSEEVYGRMDPIQIYKGTKRTIKLEWEVVAASVREAGDNLMKCTTLFGMLYPVYEGSEAGAKVVSNPPLFRVRFVNFVRDVNAGGGGMASAAESGLVCSVSGFSYSPDNDAGYMHFAPGEVYPQTIKLSCDLTVLHTHGLGYEGTNRRQALFPYGDTGMGANDQVAAPAPDEPAAGNTAPANEQQQEGAQDQVLDPTGGN